MADSHYHRLTRSMKVTVWYADQDGDEHEYRTEVWEAGTPLCGGFHGKTFSVYLDEDGNGMVYLPADAVVPIPAIEDGPSKGMPDMPESDWNRLRGE